jgi:WD40 repeat protein
MESSSEISQRLLFDGFISYSHAADGQLAPSLQVGLERIARPWYRLRALRLFRDETNLSANPNLWHSIENSLAKSRQFILLASEESAKSKWVAKEIDWWLRHRNANTLLIVVTNGEIEWDDARNCFDPLKSKAIPPALYSAFSSEPFFVDLRWARNPVDLSQNSVRLRSALLDIAATLRGVSKDEIDGEAVRTLRRNRYWALGGIALLIVATVWALVSRENAVKSSLRTSLELDARQVLALAQTKNQATALPLAILTANTAKENLSQTPVSVLSALRYGIESSREWRRWDAGGQVVDIVVEPDNMHFLTVLRNNEIRRWNLDGSLADFRFGGEGEAIEFDDDQASITFTQSKAGILTRLSNGRYKVWGLNGAKLASGVALDTKIIEVAPKSENVYSVDSQGRIHLYARDRELPLLLSLRARGNVRAIHIRDDEQVIVLVYEEGRIDVLNKTGNRISSFPSVCREATALTKRGRVLLSVGCGEVRFLDLDTKEETISEHTSLALVKGLTSDLSGNFAVTHDRDDRIEWFDNRGTPATESILGVENPAIALSPNGAWIATAGYLDGTVRLFDLNSRAVRRFTNKDERINVSTLDVCADRPQIYWATQHGQIAQVNYLETEQSPDIWTHGSEYVETVRCIQGDGVVSVDRAGSLIYWESPGKGKILYKAEPLIHASIAVTRSSRKVYMATEKGILGWNLSGEIEALETISNPLPDSMWWQILVGDSDQTIVVGDNEGSIAAFDVKTGRAKFGPRKTLWSNIWTLSADQADKGFVLAGAGTEVMILDWSGNTLTTFRTDRFIMATNVALDTTANLIVFPTMTGELIVSDLKGDKVGPPIRSVGANQFVFVRFSRDGFLFSGGLSTGVSMHDFNETRLLRTACRVLSSRQVTAVGEYMNLSTLAAEKCAALSNETAAVEAAVIPQERLPQ